MTDQTPAPMDVRPAKEGALKRLSFVWLVPLLALAISLGVAWQSYADRGVLIEISFEEASGVTAEETVVKYRDVTVGRVDKVAFDEGLGDVIVTVEIDKDIAPYLDDDAQFWVVEPDVSLRGITGLETVLSGVFIEGTWDGEADVAQYAFTGLEEPPIANARQRGTEIVLRARDGRSLADGAPILHKGIKVGYLETPELSTDGNSVTVAAFVEAPYDRRITSATRFWNTSGFSVSLGTGGVSLDVSSLASLIEGGIAFDTVVSGGTPVRDGQTYDIFDSETAARSSLFNDPDQPKLEVAVLFDGSVSGLTQGSEVRFRGIRIGEVTDLNAVVVDDKDAARVDLRTVLAIEPGRLGLPEGATPDDALAFLSDFVRQGLRARLVTGNILSGSLVVELIEVPDAPLAVMNFASQPFPVIPTTESSITDVADSAEDVLQRINDLPIEELLASAIDLMDSVERLANEESLLEAPVAFTALMEEARALVSSEDITAIPADLRAVIADLDSILANAEEGDLVGKLTTALENAGSAAASIEAATESLPEVLAQLEDLGEKANALDLEALLAEASSTLGSIDSLIGDEATQALPDTLTAAIADLRTLVTSEDITALPGDLRETIAGFDQIITDLNAADLTGQINGTITSANNTILSIDSATENLPQIMAEVQALAEKANALDLETLVAEATATLDSIDKLVGSQSTQDLPASLSAALDEVRGFLGEVREGGAINNVNAALASANEAAQAIEEAAASLPALSRRASALVNETSAVLDTYSDRSRFNAETLSTLRDIQEAADAVSSLARAIQRNPNSLLTGR